MTTRKFSILVGLCLTMSVMYSQDTSTTDKTDVSYLVHSLYELVSFEKNPEQDWDLVRSLFHPEAIITLRVSRDAHNTFNVDEFIDDFKNFCDQEGVKQYGFQETVVNMNLEVFKNIAFGHVIYEAEVLDGKGRKQQGIDSMQLYKTTTGWKIISITNDVIFPGEKIPDSLMRR